jgi:hypothetical protein
MAVALADTQGVPRSDQNVGDSPPHVSAILRRAMLRTEWVNTNDNARRQRARRMTMMIVELIDHEDFRERLVALGVQISEHACADTCARMALRKHVEVGVPGLQELVRELVMHSDILLPSVRQALDKYLLPGLR